MRKTTAEEVLARSESVADDAALARSLVVDRFGPEAAAWLVRNQKRPLHKHGAFAVLVPAGHNPKPWFDIAAAFLARRPAWVVSEHLDGKGGRVVRFRWLAWQRHRKGWLVEGVRSYGG